MKKLTILTVLSLLFTTSLFAQNQEKPSAKVDPKKGWVQFYDQSQNKYLFIYEWEIKYGKTSCDSMKNIAIDMGLISPIKENILSSPPVIEKKIRNKTYIKTGYLATGSTIIGLSFGMYAILQAVNTNKIAKLDPLAENYLNEVNKINKQNKALGYTFGATSIIGVVTILAGIRTEKEGIKIGKSTFVDSAGSGLSLTMKF